MLALFLLWMDSPAVGLWGQMEGCGLGVLPCHGQGHYPLDQVAQGLIQPHLRHLQGWDIHSLSGQPVPVPHCSTSEEFLLNI